MVQVLGTRFNNLQSRIETIYGSPTSATSTSGYGQVVRSRQILEYTLDPNSINAASSASGGDIDYANDTVNIPGHNFLDRQLALYDNNGNNPLISPLRDNTHFYVKVIDSNTIELYNDVNLTDKVDLQSGASGTHIINRVEAEAISAADVFNLYLDVVSARIHQVGSAFTISNNAAIQSQDRIEENYISTLEGIMSDVEANRSDIADPDQVSEEVLSDSLGNPVFSQRTSAWNGTIAHEFTLTFGNIAQQRGYWNAAGEIIFSPTLTGGSGTKTGDWRNIINGVGVVTFSSNGTSITGSANSVTSVNPRNLTTSYQVLVERTGASYTNNRYRIYAKRNSDSELSFRVEFADLDRPGGFGIDENVNGTIRSDVDLYRPSGNFTVNGTSYSSVNFTVNGLTTRNL